MALWTPAEITTGLWLDASDASTITIATGVSQWDDKSGNNRHAVQATGSAQPTVDSAYQNGLDALNFNGSSQFLSCGDVLDLGAVGMTAICVAQVNTPGGTNGVIYAKSIASAVAGRYHLGWLLSANYLSANVVFNTTAGVIASAAYTSTAANICGQVIDRSGSGKVLLNGVATSQSFSANTTNFNTTTRFLVGAYSNSDDTGIYSYHPGRICEVILVQQTLSTGDIQLIEGYLAHKWGLAANLPADHPYKSTAPTINKVSGIVTVNGSPAARTVAVFLRSNFTLLGTTTSDASTGVFEISGLGIPSDANALLVTAIDSTGTYNAVSVDYITSVDA